MFSGSSPKKRKIEDTEDQEITHTNWNEDNKNCITQVFYDELPSCSTKPPVRESSRNYASTEDTEHSTTQQHEPHEPQEEVPRLDRLREIISREFKREIKSKEMQIEQIDERLEEAKNLLDRLRYAIVAEYYKKQEQKQTMIDAAASMRGASGMTNERDPIPQIPLHPSVKKIIGKRPHSLAEIMRACPKREAAKNAKQVLYTKSKAERLREERRRQKVIREKGIVIDHSKEVTIKTESGTTSELQSKIETPNLREPVSSRLEGPKPHVLNSARASNKRRFHFVVGNTSKYIGKKGDSSQSSGSISLSYKWLVYVQAKDIDVPVGKYLKKVRFFLHPSYRPNDVVDIHEPPFQIARRGWGEFPMRIQLFFHDHFQQKPLQLVHKVVLDTTKSGRHTLGAETVVEVWLRDEATATEKPQIKNGNFWNPNTETSTTTATTTTTTTSTTTTTPAASLENHRKPRTISFNIKETFDDNFFDFLNKIEGSRTPVCDDIEKIEPTLLVNEPLEPKFSNTLRSPIKKEFIKSPIQLTPPQQSSNQKNIAENLSSPKTLPKAIKDATKKLFNVINQSDDPKCENQILSKNPIPSLAAQTTTASPTTSTSDNNTSVASDGSKIITSNGSTDVRPGGTFNSSSGTIILPVTQKRAPLQQSIANSSAQPPQPNLLNKTIFQKKTLQIVNAQGQVKTIQMLVPSSGFGGSSTTANPSLKTGIVTGQLITSKSLTATTSGASSGTDLSLKNSIASQSSTTTTRSSTTSVLSTESENSPQIPAQQHKSSNSNSPSTTTFPRNVVFQKEGKLYLIDPTQIKLKQQQKGKNQISLLKPQVKKQTQQASCNLKSIASDHDYAPPPTSNAAIAPLKPLNIPPTSSIRTPEVHFGVRETRLSAIKAQDEERFRRIQFERKFSEMHFNSMRGAVEFLLRRLPLIETDKESPARVFPFVRKTAREFHSLPAFKQRCFEWLRAKFIASMLRNPTSLQSLHEPPWSTREIATFARCFGYTPPIKALKQEQLKNSSSSDSKDQLASLIKTEIKSEQLQLEYETLTPASHIVRWMENIQNSLGDLQMEETIIIDDDDDEDCATSTAAEKPATSKDIVTKRIFGSPLKTSSANHLYLPPTERLETAFQLVGEVCSDISVRLRPEEIVPGVLHPAAQTILAHISHIFIERLLRQTIADRMQREQEKHGSNSHLLLNNLEHTVTPLDIRKTISNCPEFDFLTNSHCGIRNQEETPKNIAT